MSETCIRSAPASSAGAGGQRNAAFSAFVFTSPLIIQLLFHLDISTLTAATEIPMYTQKAGLIFGGNPAKDKPQGCHCVGWHEVAPNGSLPNRDRSRPVALLSVNCAPSLLISICVLSV